MGVTLSHTSDLPQAFKNMPERESEKFKRKGQIEKQSKERERHYLNPSEEEGCPKHNGHGCHTRPDYRLNPGLPNNFLSLL